MTLPCSSKPMPCGCCEGTEVLTPMMTANRPGLSTLAYRVGTHATFLETMKGRLSSRDFPELRGFTTRDSNDPAIALLDAWATVADVLTFYQERISNEGYLRTATERRSILELARLVGYTLRPGVASSVYLAFTLENNFKVEIPIGARAQSLPGPGELPQSFETSEKLETRAEWNNLKPRMTRQQLITPDNADIIETLYLEGTTTNLKPNDPLLFVFGNGSSQQVFRRVEKIELEPADNRTKVMLQVSLTENMFVRAVKQTVERYLDLEAFCVSPQAPLVGDLVVLLQLLEQGLLALDQQSGENSTKPTTKINPTTLAVSLLNFLPTLRAMHAQAVEAGAVQVAGWISGLVTELRTIFMRLSEEFKADVNGSGSEEHPVNIDTTLASVGTLPDNNTLTAFAGLTALVTPLSKPPSLQPANSMSLMRDSRQTFAAKSDLAPQILTKLLRATGTSDLYQAWGNEASTPPSPIEIYALRVTAQLFGSNVPKKVLAIEAGTGRIASTGEWPIIEPSPSGVSHEDNNTVYLDNSYDKILPNTWLVVDTTLVGINRFKLPPPMPPPILITKATNANASISRADYGFSGKTTRIELADPWAQFRQDPRNKNDQPGIDEDFQIIRRTTVYAQSELLTLAEEPITKQICGNQIELGALYNGLQSGRWVVITGERADIPLKTTGVKVSELVMLAGVRQGGTSKSTCAQFPSNLIPFSKIFYISDANASGDRLVVGVLQNIEGGFDLSQLPLPSAPNQRYCNPIELAPGLSADAYVPTDRERRGDFSSFAGLLLDPSTDPPTRPLEGGQITEALLNDGIYAWRVASDKINSNLQLANQLAFVYKRDTVTVHGNVVKATHGETRPEVLGSGDGSKPLQQFALRQSPLTYLSAPTPAGAASTLQVRVNDILWHEMESLDALKPMDRNFITRTDDQGKTTITFGNGKHGARLPTGVENVKGVYRTGIGKPGNVKAEQISLLATKPLGVKGVINPLRASGGADPESRDQARRNAPLAVMALDRLVSVKDYEDFARTYAGIGKASAVRLSDGHQELVHLSIAGAEDIPIDESSDLYRNLFQALHRFGDPFQPIQVKARELMLLVISAKVRLLPDYQWESVVVKVRASMLDTFGFERRELGQTVFLSEAISTIQQVAGVAYVDVDVLDSVSETEASTPGQLGKKLKELVSATSKPDSRPKDFIYVRKAQSYSQVRCVLSTPATSPDTICPAQLAMLSPEVPDTLILTELTA